MVDAVIVGGSHAGLSAALVLARANRDVVVIDGGLPRNPNSPVVHAFHTRDGEFDPPKLLEIARGQLAKYPHVTIERGKVRDAVKQEEGFLVTVGSREIHGRKLVLATGVRDLLPEIQGLKGLWGTLAVRCPYCDGWELCDSNLAVIGNDEASRQHLGFLRIWSKDLTLYTNGIALAGPAQNELEKQGVGVVEMPIERIAQVGNSAEIVTESGRLTYQGIFMWPELEFQNSLALQLGCEIQDSGAVQVDGSCATSIDGVYAVGDLMEPEMHMVALAVSTGLQAAFAINAALLAERTI